jgi:hypothetical protein
MGNEDPSGEGVMEGVGFNLSLFFKMPEASTFWANFFQPVRRIDEAPTPAATWANNHMVSLGSKRLLHTDFPTSPSFLSPNLM